MAFLNNLVYVQPHMQDCQAMSNAGQTQRWQYNLWHKDILANYTLDEGGRWINNNNQAALGGVVYVDWQRSCVASEYSTGI